MAGLYKTAFGRASAAERKKKREKLYARTRPETREPRGAKNAGNINTSPAEWENSMFPMERSAWMMVFDNPRAREYMHSGT